MTPPPIFLSSQSPRRRELLARLGVPFAWGHPGVDDAQLELPGGVNPASWVGALAYLKARAGLERTGGDLLVIGADTTCVIDGMVLGQPRDAHEAGWMIRAMADRDHEVLTGVALLRSRAVGIERAIFVERSRVELGRVSEDEINEYIEGGGWRGKAGAYNLSERREAGWPIRVVGSESSVMGLPLERLTAHQWFQQLVDK